MVDIQDVSRPGDLQNLLTRPNEGDRIIQTEGEDIGDESLPSFGSDAEDKIPEVDGPSNFLRRGDLVEVR